MKKEQEKNILENQETDKVKKTNKKIFIEQEEKEEVFNKKKNAKRKEIKKTKVVVKQNVNPYIEALKGYLILTYILLILFYSAFVTYDEYVSIFERKNRSNQKRDIVLSEKQEEIYKSVEATRNLSYEEYVLENKLKITSKLEEKLLNEKNENSSLENIDEQINSAKESYLNIEKEIVLVNKNNLKDLEEKYTIKTGETENVLSVSYRLVINSSENIEEKINSIYEIIQEKNEFVNLVKKDNEITAEFKITVKEKLSKVIEDINSYRIFIKIYICEGNRNCIKIHKDFDKFCVLC